MKKFNKIYNIMEALNIIFAVCANCLGYFQLTKIPNATLESKIISCFFLMGFLMQLFIDCFLGTVLYHQASLLPEAIFKSNWLKFSNVQLKKDIVFVLMHSQRIPQFNVYSLYDMNMISFAKVLKVAFSLYTVLSAIDRK
ncbi:unnamed protein product [Phyllotreta striolata]|uniref:Uncharacterized protein n=1 Tax=Phyllotreta striolata TaxID=444603 RepID=A0A9N9TNT5_PHYSR|nr:unnamed protein product [Phyllotreta striolata]